MTKISLLNKLRTVLVVIQKMLKYQDIIFNFGNLTFSKEITNQADQHKHARISYIFQYAEKLFLSNLCT